MGYNGIMSSHLIPFRGRNHSGPINQNLLWHYRNIYLMDNHRAALWCWQQEINLIKIRILYFISTGIRIA